MFVIHADTSSITRMGDHFAAVKKNMVPGLRQIVASIGPEARSHMVRVLPAQTGLKFKTTNKALRGSQKGLEYRIYSQGGDIRLKFFNARETSKGVTAAPWNQRRLYPATFIYGGHYPRKSGAKPVSGGHVMMRTGKGRLPIAFARSGLFIAEEMIKGKSLIMFHGTVEARFAPAVEAMLIKAL